MAKHVIRTDSAGPPRSGRTPRASAPATSSSSAAAARSTRLPAPCKGETVEQQTQLVLNNITRDPRGRRGDPRGRRQGDRALRGRDWSSRAFNEVYAAAHARAPSGPHDGRERPAPGARDARRGRRDRRMSGSDGGSSDGQRRRRRHRLGCARRGDGVPSRAHGKHVVLVDRFDLASQSSARAAGLSQQVQVDDVLAGLAVRGADALIGFAENTGVELEVVVNGSIKVARNEQDAAQLREEVRRGAALGADIEMVLGERGRPVRPLARAGRRTRALLQPERPLHRASRDAAAWRSSPHSANRGGERARPHRGH